MPKTTPAREPERAANMPAENSKRAVPNVAESERRLAEARKKREAVLAKKAKSLPKSALKTTKPWMKKPLSDPASLNEPPQTVRSAASTPPDETTSEREAVTPSNWLGLVASKDRFRSENVTMSKPVYFLLGGAGFGFGTTLAIGVLVGSGLLSSTGNGSPQQDLQTATVYVSQTGSASEGVPGPDATSSDGVTFSPELALSAAPPLAPAPRDETDLAMVLPERIGDGSIALHAKAPLTEPQPQDAPLRIATNLAQSLGYFDKDKLPVRFFMHAPDRVSDATVADFTAQIEATGFDVARVGRESFTVSTTHLRFYSADTEIAAKAVADELGIEARDFSGNGKGSDRVELWLAGTSASSRAPGSRPERTDFVTRFLNRWVSGGH